MITYLRQTLTGLVQMQPTMNDMLHLRRVGELGDLTGVFKGIMDQAKGSQASSVPIAPVSTSSSEYQDCSTAIQQIEEVLNTSERYMQATERAPTIADIQAVLAVLSDSIGADCDGGAVMPRDTFEASFSIVLERRVEQECSDCRRRLYVIIKALSTILQMSQEGKSGMTNTIGGAMSTTTDAMMAASSAVTTTTTVTMMRLSTTMSSA